jgi:hypothetical protein
MPKKKRTAAEFLTLFAREFKAEMKSRRWGEAEYRKLVAQSKQAGESFSEDEANLVRWTLAAVDRVGAIRAGTAACLDGFSDLEGADVVPSRPFRIALLALRKQATRATIDLGCALHAVTKLPLAKEPEPRGPVPASFVKAIRHLAPETRTGILARWKQPMSAAERALREAVIACSSLGHGISQASGAAQREVRRHRRLRAQTAREILIVLHFAALGVRKRLTETVPAAIGATARARKRRRSRTTPSGTTRRRRS